MKTELVPFPEGVDVRIEIRGGAIQLRADVPLMVAKNWTEEAARQGLSVRDALIQAIFDLDRSGAPERIEELAEALATGAERALAAVL